MKEKKRNNEGKSRNYLSRNFKFLEMNTMEKCNKVKLIIFKNKNLINI